MSDHYVIKAEPCDDATPLMDEGDTISRQGYNAVYELERLGYIVKIERVE